MNGLYVEQQKYIWKVQFLWFTQRNWCSRLDHYSGKTDGLVTDINSPIVRKRVFSISESMHPCTLKYLPSQTFLTTREWRMTLPCRNGILTTFHFPVAIVLISLPYKSICHLTRRFTWYWLTANMIQCAPSGNRSQIMVSQSPILSLKCMHCVRRSMVGLGSYVWDYCTRVPFKALIWLVA